MLFYFSKENEMETGERWTIGEVIRKLRMEQGISGQQLCRGLCSAPTFSRIEADEREAEIMMLEVILGRLGYPPDKFEIYAGKKEFILYDLRTKMRICQEKKKDHELEECIELYQKMQEGILSKLEEQFLFRMKGFLEWDRGNVKQGIDYIEQAITIIIPEGWKEKLNQYILSSEELELLDALAEMYIQQKWFDKAYILLHELYLYLEQSYERKLQKIKIYARVSYQMALVLIKFQKIETAYITCKNTLKLLSEAGSLHQIPELWECMGNCIEIFAEKNFALKEQGIACFQRSYYLYLVKNQVEEAKKIKIHLEEEYQWECIK